MTTIFQLQATAQGAIMVSLFIKNNYAGLRQSQLQQVL